MPTVSSLRQLAQKRPATTNASKIYSPPTNGAADIKSIFIANTTGSASAFSIYQDKDGSSYSSDTALYSSMAISANATSLITFTNGLILQDSTSTLGVQASTGGSLNFTVYGVETITS